MKKLNMITELGQEFSELRAIAWIGNEAPFTVSANSNLVTVEVKDVDELRTALESRFMCLDSIIENMVHTLESGKVFNSVI